MDTTPSISLIVCTHNRADILNESLSYYNAIDTNITYEILIIVNKCSDHTKEIIEHYAKTNPTIRYVIEDNLGASYARNCGWKNALGSTVFYIDDDAYPSKHIIDDIYDLIQQPNILSFTGRTIYWRVNDPKWIKASYVEMPKISDKVLAMYKDGHLNGCACGFKKSTLAQAGGFRLDLDMRGKKIGYAVEEDMRLKLLRLDIPTYYIPHIEVRHKAHYKTVSQYLNCAYLKGHYFAKVQQKSRWKLVILFILSGLKSIPLFLYKLLIMPYQNATVESFSVPLNYLGRLLH